MIKLHYREGEVTIMIKNKKKFFSLSVSVVFLFISVFSFPCSAENRNSVSEREFLILALLTYSNEFDPNNSDPVSLLTSRFFERVDINDDAITESDLDGWRIVDYEINSRNSERAGFSVAVYRKKNNLVIVPRGTDGGVFFENWKYIFRDEHPQAVYMTNYLQRKVIPYLYKAPDRKDLKIYFCGHSLGGYLALYGAGFLLGYSDFAKNITNIVTFNGLGLDKKTNPDILSRLKRLDTKKIIHYRVTRDIVSLLGMTFSKPISFNFFQSPYWQKATGWIKIIGYSAFAHGLAIFLMYDPFITHSYTDPEDYKSEPVNEEIIARLKNKKTVKDTFDFTDIDKILDLYTKNKTS